MSDGFPDYLNRYPLLRTRDLDEARSVMGQHFDKHKVELKTRIPFSTTVNHAALGDLGLTFVRCPTPLEVTSSQSNDVYRLFLFEDGVTKFELNGNEAIGHSIEGVVVAPRQEVRMNSDAVRVLILEVPGRLIEGGLVARGLQSEDIASRANSFSLNSSMGSAIRSLCQWTAETLDRQGEGLTGCRMVPEVSSTLTTLMIDALGVRHPRQDDVRIGRIQLGELEAYVLAQLRKPLTADELARVAGVSTRAIQLAFRRHWDCTPSQFIRMRRLEAVRRILRCARPGTQISDVAMDFGFFKYGDFARYYREHFGELPSDTLRNSSRRSVPKGDSGNQ